MLFVKRREPIILLMVAYHRPNDIIECVDSILLNTSLPFRLYIIDNSLGAIDKYINRYLSDNRIFIIKNASNMGKAAAINKWYYKATENNTNDFFISIDSDIVVPKGWLPEMIKCYYAVSGIVEVGAIAPAICSQVYQTWEYQMNNGHILHDTKKMLCYDHIYNGLYHNTNTAGCLLIINKDFFEANGLYYSGRIYGGDDGQLCRAAVASNRFIGINSNLMVRHVNKDSDIEYVQWKKRNITTAADKKGRWD